MTKKLKYVTDEMIMEFEDIGEESFTTFDYEKVYKELEKYIKEFRELRSQDNYKVIELYEIGEYLKILLTNKQFGLKVIKYLKQHNSIMCYDWMYKTFPWADPMNLKNNVDLTIEDWLVNNCLNEMIEDYLKN